MASSEANGSRRPFLGAALAAHGLLHAGVGMGAQDLAGGGSLFEVGLVSALFLLACPGFVATGAAAWLELCGGRAWRLGAAVCLLPSSMLLVLARPIPGTLALGVGADLFIAAALARGHQARPRSTGGRGARTTAGTLRQIGAALGVFLLAALVVGRPWMRTWGSVPAERRRWLPGDEHAGNPARAGDRAIAIAAPVEEVWPWLRQMGQDRAGFYSYEALERGCGIRITNAETIVPAWQDVREGDFVRATQAGWAGGIFGDRLGWEVDHVDERQHLLALRYWVFEVSSTGPRTSRLHVRTHAGDPPLLVAPLLMLTFEPIHFVMERAMLRGIKQRAERGARQAGGDLAVR